MGQAAKENLPTAVRSCVLRRSLPTVRGEVRRSEAEPLPPLTQPTRRSTGRGSQVRRWLVDLLEDVELQPQLPVTVRPGGGVAEPAFELALGPSVGSDASRLNGFGCWLSVMGTSVTHDL